jgi:4-hydroxybenzoate polyprenyltransferase/phosphoserine phosphatase
MNTQASTTDSGKQLPLCVDLDGTLIQSDILIEAVFALLKQNALTIFWLPLWLLKGKAYFKQQIADRVDLDVTLLPYNEPFLAYLREQKSQGRLLTLATAANIKYAERVMAYLGIFEHVLASDAETNVSGRIKREMLIDMYGEHGFDYAGNAMVDLAIWSHSRSAILVKPEAGVRRRAEKLFTVTKLFDDNGSRYRPFVKAIRLHQWMKNLLVFVPLVMSHQALNLQLVAQASIAFLAFGLCASSVYLLNDLLDLPADRRHPRKRKRPLASGSLPIKQGVVMIPLLLFAAFAISLLLPVLYSGVLLLYYIVTLAYSLLLKQLALVDVLVLAGLYTIRIIAGAAATSITPSFWLLAFSMFLFYSLALVKRYSELLPMQSATDSKIAGRGYRPVDLEGLAQAGAASGFLSVLVLALYINSTQIIGLYSHPEGIWLLCPVLLYWINRVWLLTRRGEMHDDPVVFAIRDRRSHWLALTCIIILWASS